jgi:hypothetical protein
MHGRASVFSDPNLQLADVDRRVSGKASVIRDFYDDRVSKDAFVKEEAKGKRERKKRAKAKAYSLAAGTVHGANLTLFCSHSWGRLK